MEIRNQTSSWLDESHPNFVRWKLARDISIERGKFVYSIVTQKAQKKKLSVLDLGSGEGGTAKVFSEDNFVISFDISLIRLKRQLLNVISKEGSCLTEKSVGFIDKDFSLEDSFEMTNQGLVNGTALLLPFKDHSFDLIIIQDVIEHLADTNKFYIELKRVLKKNGIIYLSTPNKLSILNFFSDPHFGLPVISIMKRESIKKYILKYFRKSDYNRSDVAQLFSLYEIISLFKKDFNITLHTKFSVQQLFKGSKGIVWSNFHIKLISFCKLLKLDSLLIKISNDTFGIVNNYFTPTFYFLLNKK